MYGSPPHGTVGLHGYLRFPRFSCVDWLRYLNALRWVVYTRFDSSHTLPRTHHTPHTHSAVPRMPRFACHHTTPTPHPYTQFWFYLGYPATRTHRLPHHYLRTHRLDCWIPPTFWLTYTPTHTHTQVPDSLGGERAASYSRIIAPRSRNNNAACNPRAGGLASRAHKPLNNALSYASRAALDLISTRNA